MQFLMKCHSRNRRIRDIGSVAWQGHGERKHSCTSTYLFNHRNHLDRGDHRMSREPQHHQSIRPCRHLERRPNPRVGANRHHRADILQLAETGASSRYARLKPRLGCVRSPGISPKSPMWPLPSSSAASWPITAYCWCAWHRRWKWASCRYRCCRFGKNAARDLCFEQPQRQPDEAVRTGAIGAMALIYAAHALGLGSIPMIDFNAEAVARELALAEDEVPVMLLSVGGGASRELAAEAAPSGGRRAGMRIVEESGLSRAAAGRETTAAVVDDKGNLRVPARGSDWIYTRGYPP
jgi:nitroreductase